MLVVDRRVVSRLQNHRDVGGMEMMEVGADLYRPSMHRRPSQPLTIASTPSFIIDSSDTSKGVTPTSLKCGKYTCSISAREAHKAQYTRRCKAVDLPPSYSEISLMMKQNRLETLHLEPMPSSNQLRDGEVTVVQMADSNANVDESETRLSREPVYSDDNDDNNNVIVERENDVEDINNNNNVVIANGHIEFVQEL
ncbi:unnamed protein product [Acanthoscelides obtectus]|uniref:Uncharacterized protein n=1 Tax=Acanthoscelides obtectus TaxID=200917 RepID=A0A9P0M5H1_ACAOB|nr:unnamed protein product [Acanthoscelides obtectus]CAK1658614.1 hypothetical protein AOBTE_LOCUS21025 [Acanthoscelides obtectus]